MPSGIVRAPISDALPPFAKHKNTHNSLSLFSLSPYLPLLSSTKLYNSIQTCSDFFCGENSPFCFFFFFLLKSQARWSRELFGKFPKMLAIISKN